MIARKFTRRDFIRMGLTTTAGAFLVGCGSTGIPSPAASTSEAKKEEPAAPAVQNMLINVWAPSCDAKCEQVYLPDWLSKYTEKHSEITFKAAGPGWDDYWTKLPLNIASGAGPDLYYFHPNWTQQFVDGGLIEAWSEADVAELKNLCSNVELRMIDGKLYFFDEGIMTGLIFYNKKMWKEAGLTDADIPKSWPQLIEIAKELTVTNSAGEIERAGFNWGHTD
ncbi:MAG: extracellular solute-binding protein, partial [Anaerolineae bacterium]